MSATLARRAGSALVWKTVQLGADRLIYLVRLVVLARLLSPDDFGLFAVAAVAVDFLLSITDVGMHPALVQHPRPERRHYDAAWTVSVTRSLAIGVVLFLTAPLVAHLFAEPRAAPLLQLLALPPFLRAAASMRLAELARELRFRALAGVRISEALASTVVAIALAGPLGVWALVAGQLAGAFVHTVASYVVAPQRPRPTLERTAVRPLLGFGRWIFLGGVVAVAGTSVLQLAISRRLGVEQLGLYYLAVKLAFLPGDVAGEVVGSVAFPVYARTQVDTGQTGRAFRTALLGSAVIIVPVTLLLVALAGPLVDHVLGPRWQATAELIRLLALLNIVGLLGDAAIPVLNGVGQPSRVVALHFVQSALIVALVWGLAGLYGVIGAALAWFPATVASQVAAAAFLGRVLRRPFAGVRRPVVAIAVAGMAGAGVAWGLARLLPPFAGLATGAAAGAAAAAGLLWLLDRRYALGLVEDLARIFPRAGAFLGVPEAAR